MAEHREDNESDSLDIFWMQRALELADKAAQQGEVPVGAIIVMDEQVIGEGWNSPISSHDPTAHAEINALRHAARHLGNYRLLDTTLYVTVEPCVMCAGALIHARVKRVVYGAREPKTGSHGSAFNILDSTQHNHRIEIVSGVLAEESAQRLQTFFKARRLSV